MSHGATPPYETKSTKPWSEAAGTAVDAKRPRVEEPANDFGGLDLGAFNHWAESGRLIKGDMTDQGLAPAFHHPLFSDLQREPGVPEVGATVGAVGRPCEPGLDPAYDLTINSAFRTASRRRASPTAATTLSGVSSRRP